MRESSGRMGAIGRRLGKNASTGGKSGRRSSFGSGGYYGGKSGRR